ncbi:MAG: DNA adenine methylase, partial [Muribaculaceae bacterium]|nr:DNA adenine methylase [Muribaculaceae bacterium]
MKSLSPVIKWFGSKRPVAEELSKHFRSSSTYFEPFVGGGAM